jgi:hypothetical protein
VLDFVLWYRQYCVSKTHKVNNTGNSQQREAVPKVQTAKDITRKKELLLGFSSIGPLTLGFVRGRKLIIAPFP